MDKKETREIAESWMSSPENNPSAPSYTNLIQSKAISLARYKFTPAEKRILTHEIHICQKFLAGRQLKGDLYKDPRVRVEKSIWDDLFVEMPLSELGATPENHTQVVAALNSLNDKKMQVWHDEDWASVRLVEMPRIYRGIAKFAIHEQLVKSFLDFSKGYNQYYLEVSLSLNSTHAMRLYELVSGNNGMAELVFTVEHLRELLAVAPEQYEKTGDFAKCVIGRAKKELDEKSPWSFNYLCLTEDKKVAKRGNKIKYIKLLPLYRADKDDPSRINKKAQLSDKALLFLDSDLRRWLLDNGWSRKEIENNRETWLDFVKTFPDSYDSFCRIKWQRAQELAAAAEEMGNHEYSAKGWFINALKGRMRDLQEGRI